MKTPRLLTEERMQKLKFMIEKKPFMRVLICIPSTDFMHSEFVKSLTALVMRLKMDMLSFDVEIMSGTLVYVARDNLAKKAIKGGYTHTLWLDSDMVFNEDLLEDLTFSNKDFVTGIYHARRPPHGSCIFKNINPLKIERFELDDYPNNTFEIAGCGFGCVLIKTDILKDIIWKCGTAFTPQAGLGEDLAFCSRVHEAGYKMYCEPGVRLGHIGHITIYPEDRAYWAELGGL